jgi:quercetin dioxygenase-like cupin family protein
MATKIQEFVDRLKTMAFVGFDTVKEVAIDHIPHEMTDFPDGKGGRWKRLMVESEDVDSCQYMAKKGHVFVNHIHYNTEIAICLGEFLIETPFETTRVPSNGTYQVPPNMPHRVTWLTDGSLILVFSPKFQNGGWDAAIDLQDED